MSPHTFFESETDSEEMEGENARWVVLMGAIRKRTSRIDKSFFVLRFVLPFICTSFFECNACSRALVAYSEAPQGMYVAVMVAQKTMGAEGKNVDAAFFLNCSGWLVALVLPTIPCLCRTKGCSFEIEKLGDAKRRLHRLAPSRCRRRHLVPNSSLAPHYSNSNSTSKRFLAFFSCTG
jgi:hypothetical protein